MHPSTFSDTILTGSSPLLQTEQPLPHLVDPRASVQYQRTREMSIDELLLENRVVFLIGEINYSSAARIIMQMLYLENQRRGRTSTSTSTAPVARSTTRSRSTTP